MKRLPPLSGLEAFVEVARTGSIKAGAEALALSSPALTRRIQSLERHVGHALFDRMDAGKKKMLTAQQFTDKKMMAQTFTASAGE